jgi:hypothetical protein
MQFIDVLAIDLGSKKWRPRLLVSALMYIILGGKDIMCAF